MRPRAKMIDILNSDSKLIKKALTGSRKASQFSTLLERSVSPIRNIYFESKNPNPHEFIQKFIFILNDQNITLHFSYGFQAYEEKSEGSFSSTDHRRIFFLINELISTSPGMSIFYEKLNAYSISHAAYTSYAELPRWHTSIHPHNGKKSYQFHQTGLDGKIKQIGFIPSHLPHVANITIEFTWEADIKKFVNHLKEIDESIETLSGTGYTEKYGFTYHLNRIQHPITLSKLSIFLDAISQFEPSFKDKMLSEFKQIIVQHGFEITAVPVEKMLTTQFNALTLHNEEEQLTNKMEKMTLRLRFGE
jgi:hypothetical protein